MSLAKSIFFCSALLAFAVDASAVTMSWSAVGNVGNAPDTVVAQDGSSGFGAVAYNYQISTYDVTNSQYVEFLNAKDPSGLNTLRLYTPPYAQAGGITFNDGNPSGSKYSVLPGRDNRPVNYVSWYDAIRFANWMNNGQDNGDTESGAYTVIAGTGSGIFGPRNGDSITRNAGASIFIPSENEWYKAAYYNPATSTYFQYPTSSNAIPRSSSPTALPNHANFLPGGPGDVTDVGAYTGTTSPYGAFDMGGNVFQWNEALINPMLNGVRFRGQRGGSFGYDSSYLRSSTRGQDVGYYAANYTSFRLASTPEPSTLALAAFGFIGLAAWGWRRRTRPIPTEEC